jgi:hypothetical protein
MLGSVKQGNTTPHWHALTFVPWTGGIYSLKRYFVRSEADASQIFKRYSMTFLRDPTSTKRSWWSDQKLLLFFLWRRRVVSKPEIHGNAHIWGCWYNYNEIPTAIPMFSGTGKPNTLLWKLSDVTGCRKINMAAAIPGGNRSTYISVTGVDSNSVPTATPHFRVHQPNGTIANTARCNQRSEINVSGTNWNFLYFGF